LFYNYYEENIANRDKLFNNYLGISRKEYPKWVGWKIIDSYRLKNEDIKLLEDEYLSILVINFYYLKYIKEFFYSKSL